MLDGHVAAARRLAKMCEHELQRCGRHARRIGPKRFLHRVRHLARAALFPEPVRHVRVPCGAFVVEALEVAVDLGSRARSRKVLRLDQFDRHPPLRHEEEAVQQEVLDPAREGRADVGHLAVVPEAETAAPESVVPHEHDPDIRDRLHQRFDAARAADVLQVLPLQTAGRVEQDVLAGLQAAGDLLQRLAGAIAGAGAAALQVRQDAGPVEQGDVPEDGPVDLVLVRERAQLERGVQARDDERRVQQRGVVRQEQNAASPLSLDGLEAADFDAVAKADDRARDVREKPGERRHQGGEHATSTGMSEQRTRDGGGRQVRSAPRVGRTSNVLRRNGAP